MGLQLSSTKKKKPFLSSQQTYVDNQLLSPPSCNESFLSSSRNVSSCSSVDTVASSDSTTTSSDSSSCEPLVVGAAASEEGEDWYPYSSMRRSPIYISSSKHSTSAATRHKLQQKLTKPEDKKSHTCTLHLKVVATKTTHKNKNSQNYFGHIAGPTVPLTSGRYTNSRPKPSSMSFEHLAKHHLYYNKRAYSYPAHHSSHYIGQHVRHAHSSTAAAATPRTGGRSPQSFGKRKPSSTAAAAAAAAAAVAAAAATQKTAATATAGKDTVPRSIFYHGGDESHRLRSSETHSFTSYSFCRWFEASANPSNNNNNNNNSGFYPLDTPYCAKHVKDVYCPLDTLDMLNKLAHWFLFPIANDIDLDTECTYNRYLGVSGSGASTDAGATHSGEIDIFQGLTSFLSSIVRKVFQIDFSQSVGTTFPDSSIVQPQSPDKEKEKDAKGAVTTSQDDNNHYTSIDTIEPTHTLFHSISSIDSEEARFSTSSTSNNTQQQQRYLDIECILRLPTMIYDEEGSSSDGFVGSIDTYDTDGGKSIKMDHEDTIPADENNKVPCQKGSNHHNAISLEWSWITVPRQEDPSQSIHSIASLEETAHDVLPSPFQNQNKEDDQCVICFQKFVRGESLCILPCHHSVHTTCIDKWLCTGGCGSLSSHHDEESCTRNALCPMCQSPLRIDNDHPHHLHHGNGGNECLHSIKSIASEESFVMEHHHGVDDADSIKSMNLDGLVPSWAFERLGSKIAK